MRILKKKSQKSYLPVFSHSPSIENKKKLMSQIKKKKRDSNVWKCVLADRVYTAGLTGRHSMKNDLKEY